MIASRLCFLFTLGLIVKESGQFGPSFFEYNNSFDTSSVAELNTILQKTLPSLQSEENVVTVNFRPSIIIDSSIDIGSYSKNASLLLDLRWIKGFQADIGKPVVTGAPSWLDFELQLGSFDFFDRQDRLLNSSCISYLMSFYNLTDGQYHEANKSELLMNYVGIFSFHVKTFDSSGDMAFKNRVCPLVFKGANITIFQVLMMQNTAISRNQLEFVDTTSDSVMQDFPLDCYIDELDFKLSYRLRISSLLLNEKIFSSTSSIQIHGVVESIAIGSFRNLQSLKRVDLTLYNLRNFLHSSDNRWMSSLNFGNDYDPDLWFTARQTNQTLFESMVHQMLALFFKPIMNEYEYPDEDFCLFQHVPFRQLVLPKAMGLVERYYDSSLSNLSCTLVYLNKYTITAMNQAYIFYDQNYSANQPADFDQMIQNCQLPDRLEKCKLEVTTSSNSKYKQKLSVYDAMYILQWIELIGPIITFPLVSILGFISNLLIVLVIRNKTNQKEIFKGKRIYQYMLINSLFNMAECFLSVFTLMGECLGLNSLFCSTVMSTVYFAYFKIYVIQYLGEVMKTCSLMTMLAFSIERYIATDSNLNLNGMVKSFTNRKFSHLLVCIVAFSLLTCVCKVFELSTKLIYVVSIENPGFNILKMRDHKWFAVIYIMHYFINDGLFFLMTFFVDIKLFLLVRRDLALKKVNTLFNNSAQESKKLASINKAESEMNKMVVSSFVFYLLCRLPELAFYFHLILLRGFSIQNSEYFIFCQFSLCSLLMNIIQYLYMISYSTNIFFYFKFNKQFRTGMKNFLKI